MTNEPNYTYVVGKGWVASYAPVVTRVKEDEVRVGDVIVGWSYRGRVANVYGMKYTISSVANRTIMGRNPAFNHFANGSVDWFEVER